MLYVNCLKDVSKKIMLFLFCISLTNGSCKKNQKQTKQKNISGALKERTKKKLEYSLYDNDIRIHDLSQKDRQQKINKELK